MGRIPVYKCINCDSPVDELYKIYSPTVSKLTTCVSNQTYNLYYIRQNSTRTGKIYV